MKRINNKGFSKIEFMTVLGVVAVLIAIGAKMAVDTGKNYKSFKTLAVSFMNSVAIYKDKYTKDNNVYYLNELIEKGYSDELKNPNKASEYCDKYESFVDITTPNDKKVYLVCGNYIVEGTQLTGYKIYEVTDWKEEKDVKDNETIHLYNYKEDGKNVLSEYYQERTFIQKYFEKTKDLISSPFELKENLVTKNVYRKKTLLKEVK